MIGAIIGDVAGSYYEVLEVEYLKKKKVRPYEERIKILDSNVDLFTKDSSCTDDSILTYCIYEAIKNNSLDYSKYLKERSLAELSGGLDVYGRSKFGSGYVSWVFGDYQGTSYGNGSAMRISPVGFMFDSLEDVKTNSYLATIPSHNHPDSIKAAEALAVSIYLLRTGNSRDDVLKYVKDNYYELDYDLEDLRHNYKFSSKAANSVPQAMFCFFVSDCFESTIRNAISIGGDTDTIACMAGALAEAYWGVPEHLLEAVKPYLKDYMQDICNFNTKKFVRKKR